MEFPDFKYYALDRDIVEVRDGALVPAGPVPKLRAVHADILNAAVSRFKNEDGKAGKQRWANAMLWSWFNWLPGYFFEAPASSTHKYHPAWADRPDGLLLHSLAVCRVASSLSDLFELSPAEYNTLLFAAWHHDMFKYGGLDKYEDGKMTVHEHPVLAGDFFRLDRVRALMAGFGISGGECDKISDLISTHAGPYRTSRFSDLKLPECSGPLNKLLYKADYVASRKEDAWVSDLVTPLPDPQA